MVAAHDALVSTTAGLAEVTAVVTGAIGDRQIAIVAFGMGLGDAAVLAAEYAVAGH